jgi:arylesterase/paraoxonase
LYASHTTGHELFVLDRNIKTGGLILKKTIKINSGLDNIDVDENDHIWVTGHPKVFDFLAHFKDSNHFSASELYEITLVNDEYKVSKFYENDGSQISAASVVVAKNDTLFVGCVFDDKVVKLHRKKP